MHFWLKQPKVYDLIQYLATGGFMGVVARELGDLHDKTILDLGCGTGGLIDYVKPKKYMGWDINTANVDLAKQKYPDTKRYKFAVRDIVQDALPARTFDYAITINVLHHLTEPQVKTYFKRVAAWGRAKQFVLVESKPQGPIGTVLGKMDAGDNFRDHAVYLRWLAKYFTIQEHTTVYAPWKTYKYLIVKLTKK